MRGVCAPATPRKEKLGRKSSATMSTTGRGRRNSARAATAATTIDAKTIAMFVFATTLLLPQKQF